MAIRVGLLRSSAFIGTIVAASAAVVMLNFPRLQFEPLLLWVRVACPMLLAIGILGSLYGSRFSRICGWFGILLFIGSAIGIVLPGEDYMSGGLDGPPLAAPRMVAAQEIFLRLALCTFVIAVLVVSYFRLGKLGKVP